MGGSHSLLSPSSAERWTRCPGSVALCKDIPSPPNEASALGTAKHELQYWCLTNINALMTADGQSGLPWTADGFAGNFTDEDVEHVNYCLKHIRAIPGELREYEIQLDTTPVLGVPDQSGTADAIIGNTAARVLNIIDSKFGYGFVEAEENRQLLLYAAAALYKYDEFGTEYDTVRLWILQPKRGEPRMWECSVHTVRTWGVTCFWAEAQKAILPDAPLVPGDIQCQWCPVRANCAARAAFMMASFPIEGEINPTGLIRPSANALTEEGLADALNRVDAVEAFCRDIRAEALKRALEGKTIPGYKLIEGKRGNRKWSDAALVESLLAPELGDSAYKKSLISPTDLERIAKKSSTVNYADYAAFIDQAPGAPSLAKWSEEGTPLPRAEFGLEEAQ